MIERYTLPEIGKIWSDRNRFSIWLEIEILATEAQTKLGIVPEQALSVIKQKAAFNEERILEIEAEVHHDVIAFLTNVAEYVGDEARSAHHLAHGSATPEPSTIGVASMPSRPSTPWNVNGTSV